MGIFNTVEFKAPEHERRGECRDLVLTVGHKFRAASVGGQLIIAQPSVRHDAARDFADLFVALDGGQQFVCG